ncbi:MAG TPA: hypothetical protein VFA08_13845 [Actinomycetota bacterium]|jgi:hypothetical protein|nr:hypothetical protein [Actinomycetota bacterium]
MNVRAKFVAAVVGASTAFTLYLAGPAAADDPLGGVADQTGDAIDSTVSDTTQVVSETVDGASDVASDATTVASEPTTTAGQAVGDVVADTTAGVRDTVTAAGGAVGDASASTNTAVSGASRVGDASIATDGSTDSAYSSGGGSGDTTAGGLDGDRQRDEKGRNDRSRANQIGDQEWVWRPADRLKSTWENVPVGMRAEQVAVGDESDPCRDDPGLVCLGILYEMGRYAKIVTSVLGVLATTGIGVIGLVTMAVALGMSGSAALVAACRRSPAAATRG